MTRQSHIYTLLQGRPFSTYVDQPDTAERVRLAVQSIPFALPPKRVKWDAVGEAGAWPPLPEEAAPWR